MRRTYDSAPRPHPCGYFIEWGHYHSYDYRSGGPPESEQIVQPAVYAGKRPVMPELLSGCRKAPIVCVGINPNLPGWTSTTGNAIHPYFDDLLQYAHYFRYRTRDKLRIPQATYDALVGATDDGPDSTRPLIEIGSAIPVERSPVLMYQQYQTLLDGLAVRRKWQGHKLSVGEDIAYANMVACPSTRWVERQNNDDPEMPVMGTLRARGIVSECFYERRYFLRQLIQSMPPVILVFSSTTARQFISALTNRFSMGAPQVDEPLGELFTREIRLSYGTLDDGTVLDARVIFMPHASARPQEFAQVREPCIDQLTEEVDRGNLVFNPATGHLQRGRGSCVFCSNSLYRIGSCNYEAELRPLSLAAVQPLSASTAEKAPADKSVQLRMLEEFTNPTTPAAPMSVQPLADTTTLLVLLGKVVTIATAPLEHGAVYVRDTRIVDVKRADEPPPEGFVAARVIDTGGVIYPGLIDLHNHLAYNVLPLWIPPRRFDNRGQWLRRADYRRAVSEPMEVIAKRSGENAIKAVIRYIEVKLLVGGVTCGQGMRSIFGGNQLYQGLVRNFEAPDDAALPRAETRVPDLRQDQVETMRADLATGAPYFFHLSEGIDTIARRQFELIRENALVQPNLIGIHSLALTRDQHQAMAQSGAGLVWSPLSNMLLYGQSIDPAILLEARSHFGLGSDWTPSGSRNILQELKVAWLSVQQVVAPEQRFSLEDIARAATLQAAQVAGWGEHVGSIERGKLADFTVLDNRHADVYENLLRSTERHVRLVMVGGTARYGSKDVVKATGIPESALETLQVGGLEKSLYLRQPGSPIGSLTFAAARQRLLDVMGDLKRIRESPTPLFEPLASGPTLTLELDMQPEELDPGIELFADQPPLDKAELDSLTVVDDPSYFDVLETIENLPAWIKGPAGLRGFYN